MQLKSIHFSGFKSFVDPTTLKLPAKIIGIVGPNGCGKSNVIDAVRWVMGESSAKTLRGDSMEDVIFNGSSSRQPVGKATVELLFDNSSASAPGAYSQYAEISVKRSLSRDGQSDYFLNNVRCRRKDITELFLGTGLGPRSYSIIEQGMVSRIVEAKPDDLRAFVEEASGVSKYKEKRRETENRIRRTRENLGRVNDIAAELETQLKRLDRQSKQATRYQELKTRQRELKAKTLALKWQEFDHELANVDVGISREEKQLESFIARQREAESAIETLRIELATNQEALNHRQGEYYSAGADITALEQKIEHDRQTRENQQHELKRLNEEIEQARQRNLQDHQRQSQLEEGLARLTPQVERLRHDQVRLQTELDKREQALKHWQQDWEQFQAQSSQTVQDREVLRARIEHFNSRQTELTDHQRKLLQLQQDVDQQISALQPAQLQSKVEKHDLYCQDIEKKIAEKTNNINVIRDKIKKLDELIETDTGTTVEIAGKLASLKELQNAALGEHDEQFNDWLASQSLNENPRLSSMVKVESGWEKAVDTALNQYSASVCVAALEPYADVTDQFEHMALNLVERSNQSEVESTTLYPQLLTKLEGDIDLSALLGNVLIADSVQQAIQRRGDLAGEQCFITRQGTKIGRNWISIAKKHDVQFGMIERQAQITELSAQHDVLRGSIASLEDQRSTIRTQLNQLESSRTEHSQQLTHANTQRTELHKQLGQQEEQLREIENKKLQLHDDAARSEIDLQKVANALKDNVAALQLAQTSIESNQKNREDFERQRDELQSGYQQIKSELEQVRDLLDNDNVRLEKMATALESVLETLSRTEDQLASLSQRQSALQQLFDRPEHPQQQSQDKLHELLAKRQDIEQALQQARNHVTDVDNKIQHQNGIRQDSEQQASQVRTLLESSRLNKQEIVVKQQGVKEQLVQMDVDIEKIIQTIEQDASYHDYQQSLDQLEARIGRLGTVNLLAIEEYNEQRERKVYLEKQHDDLTQALQTLEDVMSKIDRETRQRFKETFDKLNAGFQAFFPKLFGGGAASLNLTEDDLLTTGVSVMAQPPGKRNSTIHLLSGGEKALTAVSLLFSLFKLNPSPFCILDEVDAPLDDANVERYCRSLMQLAEHTQLMFITHNKITMEFADLLIGVTMQEPGVSRLVAVDVEKALELADQG